MQLKAWVISLDDQNQTARNLIDYLQQNQVDVELFPAVDGRGRLPELHDNESLNQAKARAHRRRDLTSSEIGCYLSHLRAIRKAYEQGVEYVALFEDDVIAEPDLASTIKELATLPKEFHMVRLMELKPTKRKVIKQLGNQHWLTRPLRGTLGTQGYVLNRQGMELVLDYGSEVCMPIDKLYDNFFMFGLHCYAIEPHVIHETPSSSNVSKAGNLLSSPLAILRWQMFKLHRSLRRRFYLLRHYSEMMPAEKCKTKPGKSARMR
ncbi:MAG: glycosyltransferase family 25 protein [Ketobacter sp.]|nr:MAG: glycosyltransferase family 25 protein [Ketobacter sp.]